MQKLLVFATAGLVLAACQSTGGQPAASAPSSGEPIPPSRIQAEWVGKTVEARAADGKSYLMSLKPDGTAALGGAGNDVGNWRLTDTGYCAKWTKIRGGAERCFTVRRTGGETVILNPDGSVNTTVVSVK